MTLIWSLVAGVSRFWGKDLIMAVAFGVGSVALVIGGAVAYHSIKATLVAARDGEWQSKIAKANQAHEAERERRDKAADEAAEAERKMLKEALDAEIDRAADLERMIAKLKQSDAVAVPKELARELRR